MATPIDLDVLQVGVQLGISDSFANDVTLDEERAPDIQMSLINAFMKMPGQRFDPVTISYPADWWQAFKGRWFPRLSARWFPVRYASETFNPAIYYPQIKLPDEPSYLHVDRFSYPRRAS